MNLDLSSELTDVKETVSCSMDNLSAKMMALINETKTATLTRIGSLEEKVKTIEEGLNSQGELITALEAENKALSTRNELLDGRLTRVERLMDRMRDETLDQTARSMRDNLVFYRIPENKREDLHVVLRNFFRAEMDIPGDTVDRIHIIRLHIKGAPGAYDRPIIAQLSPSSVDTIMKHTLNLKGKPYGVNVQLPPILEERKKHLLPIAKAAAAAKMKVRWSRDVLFVDGVEHKVKRDVVKDINVDRVTVAQNVRVIRAPPKTYNMSTFQASKVELTTQDDVIPSLDAIYRDTRVATADKNTYAYRLETANGI